MREIHAKNVSIIDLGRQGENLATQVIYDLSDWIAEYGDGTAELIHKRVGDLQPYPVAAVREGNTLIWTVTSTDTAVATKPPSGYGKCELRWYSGDVLAKSKTWKTMVSQAMDTPSETAPPDPEQGWVDQVLAAGASAKEAADKAFSALSNAPYIGDNGNWYLGGTDTGKPSRGEAGPALAVTNTAAVGQTVKITAVDENGQPTEWEAVDMPSGGGGGTSEEFILLAEVTLEEAVLKVTLPLSSPTKHFIVRMWCPKTSATDSPKYLNVGINGSISNLLYYFSGKIPSKDNMTQCTVEARGLNDGNWAISAYANSGDAEGALSNYNQNSLIPIGVRNNGIMQAESVVFQTVVSDATSYFPVGSILRVWGV